MSNLVFSIISSQNLYGTMNTGTMKLTNITEKDKEKISDLIFLDEARSTCIQLEFVSDYSHESNGEKHGSYKRSISTLKPGSKKSKAGCTDEYTRKY